MTKNVLLPVFVAVLFLASCGLPGGNPSLVIDDRCRDGGTMRQDGETWSVFSEPLPDEWQFLGEVQGDFQRISDTAATFTVDGRRFELIATGGESLAVCQSW